MLRRAVVLFAILGFGGCSKPPCGNRIIGRAVSTDNQRVAYVLVRDCGATTGISTNVAIGALHDLPEDADIIFTADDNHGKAGADRNLGGAIWAQVVWTGPRILSVAYAKDARIYRSSETFGDATVKYRASGPYEPPPPPVINEYW